MSKRDYYEVLGVDRGVSETDVKKAYRNAEAIVTNPPYTLAQEFIEHSLDLMEPVEGVVAMLLRNEYDGGDHRLWTASACERCGACMNQTKKVSFIEACINTGLGYIISNAVWLGIIVPYWDIGVRVQDGLLINAIFTIISIVRSYIVRRFFNTYFHRFAEWLARKLS